MNDELEARLAEIEKVLYSGLPENIDKNAENAFFGQLPENMSGNIFKLITPCKDLMQRGGKRWRPLLAVLSCELAGGNTSDIYPLTPLVEFCHTASLIHDDIEDNSEERRGGAAIHIKYGLDTALNAGSWLYFHASNCIDSYEGNAELKNLLYKLYSLNLRRLHLGQAMDIAWHSKTDYIPSREEYLTMIGLKTGSLAKFAAELGFAAARKSEKEIASFGLDALETGLAFQILDDVKNITKGNKGKNRGDDIVEGKKSLPVILCIEKKPSLKEKICDLFTRAAAEGINSPAVEECISLIIESGAAKQAEKYAEDIVGASLIKLQKNYGKNKASDLTAELFSSICGV
ncbi:polyprenyl synthetase family protein [Treponema pedis]|uniref:Polyprenyl synthetase family protein n=1 Tax=Treponema pedis TaxID=409322 RepID=A0A7S7AW17_9SPIR|nr:polyprenyl synthetase family protein [Treponema pedis]QOW59656.1 polyprenyl synthetase family protein [Treponema pedis]